MNDYEPSPQETDLAQSTTIVPPIAESSVYADKPKVRRVLTKKRCRSIVATAMLVPMIALSAGLVASASVSAAQPASGSHSAGAPPAGGSNARSGPAAGGSSGRVDSVSKSDFTMSTSAGQKVAVEEASSTKYKKGSSSTPASAINKGDHVLVRQSPGANWVSGPRCPPSNPWARGP